MESPQEAKVRKAQEKLMFPKHQDAFVQSEEEYRRLVRRDNTQEGD